MKEPRISRYVNLKTRCQASPFATDELNRLIQWPTAIRPWPPRGGETAARRLCSAQPGRDALERAFIMPAPARTQPRSHFASGFLSSSLQQPPSARSSAVAIATHSSR